MTDAAGSSKKPGEAAEARPEASRAEGLSAEERRMLDALGSGGETGALQATAPEVPRPRPVETADEELVLRRAHEESERLVHSALRRMFESADEEPVAEPAAAFEALLAQASEGEAEEKPPEPSAFERSRFGRALAATLDLVNAPFRWLPAAYRLGLGLCGVLLLITLLTVILVRMLRP